MAAEIARERRPPLYHTIQVCERRASESASGSTLALLSPSSSGMIAFEMAKKLRQYAGHSGHKLPARAHAERRDNGNPPAPRRGGRAAPSPHISFVLEYIFLRGRPSFRSMYLPYGRTRLHEELRRNASARNGRAQERGEALRGRLDFFYSPRARGMTFVMRGALSAVACEPRSRSTCVDGNDNGDAGQQTCSDLHVTGSISPTRGVDELWSREVLARGNVGMREGKMKEADKCRKQVEWAAYKIDGKLSAGERIRRRGEFDAKTRRGEETGGELLRALSSHRKPDVEWKRVLARKEVRRDIKKSCPNYPGPNCTDANADFNLDRLGDPA
ncbi:hypothetical protein DBV15_02042 [Temnothorax longispinosus]|uniref:Uncharacterized protein n=1 Tax=Temnothorax longispinosus TaxID=300112 RepID=A0A4S2KJ56_9HYME|nr:hypothetical protein DBV15_02042 [Temnothorax longispinosus]